MKKVYLIALVFLSLGISGCNSVGDDAKFLECLARDRTSNPCN
jgi:hypothetical protein